ncbi:metal-sensing transcriptional repressor, partial [Clostridium lacusfryxellense]
MNKDQLQAIQSLKTSRGQIDGIIKMMEDGRYCIDVSNQIIA